MTDVVDQEPRQLTRISASADLTDMLSALERDGGVIVEGMFPPDVMAAMLAASNERAEHVVPGSATQGMGEAGAAFVGQNTIRFSSLGLLCPSAFFAMLDNPLFEALADAVLLPTCGSYWVNTGQVMFIGPGEKAQALHRDADNWWEFVRATWPNTPEITLSAMIGLEAVTAELGATRVVPGSHQWEDLNLYEDVASVPAELGSGDALVYSGNVLHGGGANQTSDQWRRAMHLSFVAGWLTPEEACAIDFTTEELLAQSPRVQRLLGHRSYSPGQRRGGGLWLKEVRAIEDAQQ